MGSEMCIRDSWDAITEEIVDLYDEDTLIDLLPDATDNQSA